MKRTVSFYNEQSQNFKSNKILNSKLSVDDFIDTDPKKISWNRNLKQNIEKYKIHSFKLGHITLGHYRPFNKQRFYFDKDFNAMLYQNTKLFPNNRTENIVFSVNGLGATVPFSTLIINNISDLGLISAGQCFPLYYYEENNKSQKSIFDLDEESDYIKRDGVSNFILERALIQYGTKNITKEDIFYYVYGFLHSPEYRETFSNDLKKMLPRLPLVDDVRDFWSFSKSGRELGELHLNYEQVPRYDGVKVIGEDSGFFKVEKMRFPKKDQKDTIIYNSKIVIQDIPMEVYEYMVNGKSAIEWIMERYQITTHKESQITNDPNDWCVEVGNPRYILDLLLSIINVSMQTREIVQNLPKMKFE